MNKTIYSRQGQCLRETIVVMRRKAGLTQRQLAARLKREHNLIGRLELGERRLDMVEFYWICKACGANPETVARKLMRKLEEIQAAGA
jgi:transcriptional regulator with XRE-family HTH domain